MLDLTGPKILRGLAGRYRELELDDKTFDRAHKVFTAALAGGRHRTRAELGEVLRKARISTEGQRLPHLLSNAELTGLIVSGPRHGKQFTYALLEERATKARAMERSDAIAELTRRYFQSHGPAQLQNFAWWSGLTTAEARTGVRLAEAALDHEAVDGKEFWFDAKAGRAPEAAGVTHLLPNFDEFTVAYRDRAAIEHERAALSSILTNVVAIAGRVRGTWGRKVAGGSDRVEVRTMDRFTSAERASVEDAGRRYGRFLERPTKVAWQSFV